MPYPGDRVPQCATKLFGTPWDPFALRAAFPVTEGPPWHDNITGRQSHMEPSGEGRSSDPVFQNSLPSPPHSHSHSLLSSQTLRAAPRQKAQNVRQQAAGQAPQCTAEPQTGVEGHQQSSLDLLTGRHKGVTVGAMPCALHGVGAHITNPRPSPSGVV